MKPKVSYFFFPWKSYVLQENLQKGVSEWNLSEIGGIFFFRSQLSREKKNTLGISSITIFAEKSENMV